MDTDRFRFFSIKSRNADAFENEKLLLTGPALPSRDGWNSWNGFGLLFFLFFPLTVLSLVRFQSQSVQYLSQYL